MRVVVEPVVRTADLAWEAPAKQSLVFYLLLSDDRSIAGGVAAAGIAAAGCKHLVLQQQVLLVLLWPSQQQEVVVHQSGRKPSEWAVGVAKLCGWWYCGSWASPRNPEGKNEKKRYWTTKTRNNTYTFTIYFEVVRDNTWHRPSNPRAGLQKWRVSPYRARVTWPSPPISCAGPDLAV